MDVRRYGWKAVFAGRRGERSSALIKGRSGHDRLRLSLTIVHRAASFFIAKSLGHFRTSWDICLLPTKNRLAKSTPKTVIVPPCQGPSILDETGFPLRAKRGCRYGDKITKPLQTLAWHDGTMFTPTRRGGESPKLRTLNPQLI